MNSEILIFDKKFKQSISLYWWNGNKEKMYIYDEKLIVTMGSAGCRYKNKIYPVDKVEIKDLSGAGATFLAAMVYKYLNTKNIEEALKFANVCSTIVVQQKGVNILNGII